jgi:hypothetical protein
VPADDVSLGERELEVMTWLRANDSGTVAEVKEVAGRALLGLRALATLLRIALMP